MISATKNLSPEKIKNKYKIFRTKKEVIDWTMYIFERNPIEVIKLLNTGVLSLYNND
ncbi:MAG: hypothetical protein ACFFAH_16325 [Promethearchaeota archaeon]